VIVALAVASFVVAWAAARLLVSRFGSLALDRPNERSLHERPVPRTGGIALLLGAALASAMGGAALWLPLALALALAAFSFVDDLRGMPTAMKLVAHFAACALFAWYDLAPMLAVELALLIVAGVWLTNLYNFMDGSDGLAGGMAAIGFGAYAAAAGLAGHLALASVCIAVSAAAVGFLVHNFPPARIFMGDVGSIPSGFLVFALGISGWREDLWPLWFPLAVFGVFIGDATLTLLKRLVRGERVWRAHRGHYYQRVVLMGFGHRNTALGAYGAMLACAVAALYGRNASPEVQAAAFGAVTVLLAGLAVWIDLAWWRFVRRSGKAA
jgi:UDP-N-acetylmuramyl pentapeptide phosphotransferase/UDP-N-acetylglucosamine-1-phosphate transferase